ncbi:hypothetical protein JTB14_013475 [Gonioctena quinquepunctata]|nr:hypothetical protein JTB14_013475 [Gonioctena quinquepunctata]
MERFKFNNVKQEQEDTISSFMVKLKKMSESCNFRSFLKDALRDHLVSGLASGIIQAKLLSEKKHGRDMQPSLNVGKMSISKQSDSPKCQQFNVHSWSEAGTTQFHDRKCFRCGRLHDSQMCLARYWKYFYSGKIGHTLKICKKTTRVQSSEDHQTEVEKSEENVYELNSLDVVNCIRSAPLVVNLNIEGKNLQMEADTEDRSRHITGFTANIVVKENSNLIFHKPYAIPYSMKTQVGEELDIMVKDDLLKATTQSDIASPIVIVKQKMGDIHICVDFEKTLNPILRTDHYPFPDLNEMLQIASGMTVFTILDLSTAYLQLQVSDASQNC